MTIGLRLRPAVPTDAEALRCIERLAGEAFRTIGMDWVADGEVPSVDTLVGYAAAGRSWVAVTLDET
ncbi:MAG: hypothetical protein ABIQ39_14360, partial [Ilumatobacteraceae bacterium]